MVGMTKTKKRILLRVEDTALHDSNSCQLPFSACSIAVAGISLNGVFAAVAHLMTMTHYDNHIMFLSCSIPSLVSEVNKKKHVVVIKVCITVAMFMLKPLDDDVDLMMLVIDDDDDDDDEHTSRGPKF